MWKYAPLATAVADMCFKTHMGLRCIGADAWETGFVTAALAKAEGKSEHVKA